MSASLNMTFCDARNSASEAGVDLDDDLVEDAHAERPGRRRWLVKAVATACMTPAGGATAYGR
jgi:hypothetical protein